MAGTTDAGQRTAGACLDTGTLRAVFPGWRIFRDGDAWVALRRGSGLEHYDGPGVLLRHYLRAGSAGDLAVQLCLQEWLDWMPASELASVRGSEVSSPPRSVSRRLLWQRGLSSHGLGHGLRPGYLPADGRRLFAASLSAAPSRVFHRGGPGGNVICGTASLTRSCPGR